MRKMWRSLGQKSMLRYSFFTIVLLIVISIAVGCRRDAASTDIRPDVDLQALPAFDGKALNVVVEIPAGTNHKFEYDAAADKFFNDSIDGQTRIIDFLPYPGNYGFIAGTLMEKSRGGDGDPLDVLLIAESMPTGAVVKALPIGALLLKDRGEEDTKIIAVPADESLRVMKAQNFIDFMLRYDQAKLIIEQWFMAYKGAGVTEFIRWEDEQYALREVNKWVKK